MNKRIMKSIVVVAMLIPFLVLGMLHVQAHDHPAGDMKQLWWWGKEKDKSEDDLPDLRGGSEDSTREKTPVSLIELQQKYPETLALQGPTNEKKIALTFDDGPDPRFTPQILDTLSKYNVPATFFLMGARAEAYPEIAKRIGDEGHIVGNHTYWHPNLVAEGEIETLAREVTNAEDKLAEILGFRTSLFRPPYGFLYDELLEKLREMNYSVIGWSVDSLDWQALPPEETAENVIQNIHPGAIVLMHDGTDIEADLTGTIESLDIIIPNLQEQGYEFVTVPQLLNIPYEQ
ncbi:polysaccharide deacetylase family protein [Evansella sp. AB-P1]|uniref:polysaccharide deacetylase family protein n=1 Tax=Evansella sp. AB-P1 TaxID=3037653 RepID=UPI00241CA672|nr:polysaccharide deacetylase family protein [Evansella sp. AB-P1]MDG5789836.1 polysaccharide deacetylase family protein [Evansella sp. AB-P1]